VRGLLAAATDGLVTFNAAVGAAYKKYLMSAFDKEKREWFGVTRTPQTHSVRQTE
jgi:hypothetical protein